jgi:hypothetical protein
MKTTYKKLHEAQREGYIIYAGPYKSVSEAWMVDNALNDIYKNKRDLPCLVKIAQQIEIHIIPNYYGKHDRPYLTYNQLAALEVKEHFRERLEDVEREERKIKKIGLDKPIKQESEEGTAEEDL